MTTTSETPGPAEEFDPAALAAAASEPAAADPPTTIKRSSRKSILALSVCALAINGSAAIYTLPSGFPAPNLSSLAELLPRREESAKTDPVLAALRDIQSAQQQQIASLQENNRALQENSAVQQQDSLVVLSLRQSITDERVDVKKISSQLSALLAKIDSLQNTMMSDVTSSIRSAHARYGLSAAMRKRMIARESKSVGPVSVGGAPLSMPAATSDPES